MKERPIIFSSKMVRAILDGKKTQTRRVVKSGVEPAKHWNYQQLCPYGVAGDRLWVREAFFDNYADRWDGSTKAHDDRGCPFIHYRADGIPDFEGEENDIRWTPSIHMPRWASRITLELVRGRCQYLHEISEGDAIAEGIERTSLGYRDYTLPDNVMHGVPALYSFETLWDSINGDKPGKAWKDNPLVWAIEFRRVQQ